MLLVLVAAACGGGSSDSDCSGPDCPDAGASGGDGGAGGGGDDTEDDQGGGGTGGGPADVVFPPDGPPQSGGTLVYGLGSETDGWMPTTSRWAVDGTTVAMAIFDPLAAFDADGGWAPYLAESFVPNADFTLWTITLRPGVEFHDRTPLTAQSVATSLDAHRTSALTAPALSLVEDIRVTGDLTLEVVMSEPWAVFPVMLTGQAGVVPAPVMFTDAEASRNPVGTGPFRFVSWEPDSSLVVDRNPDYWQTDSEGNQLPYLDGIDFRPLPDESSRVAGIETGQVHMVHTVDVGSISRFRDMAAAGDLQMVQQREFGEVSFVLLNLAAPPFEDPVARRAVVAATDPDTWVEVIGEGLTTPADSIFRPASPWHAGDVGYPGYDPEAARSLVAEYEDTHGEPLTVRLAVLASASSRENGEFLQAMWGEVGIEVEVAPTQATTYILDAVTGNYQAAVWGQFGSPDPDIEHVWWLSSSSAPLGDLSLNFPRNEDPELDAALARARATDDPDARRAAYADVQARLAEDLPYVFLDYVVPVKVAAPEVRGMLQDTLPGGEPSLPMGGPGSFSLVSRLTQTWLES